MTDEELLAMLRKKYPALYDELTRRGYSCEAAALADLRRLMADQWNEAAHLVYCDTLQCQRKHIETGYCETSYDLLEAKAEHLRARAAALRQSREKEKCDE